ncbi:hypothetical protein HK096_000903 [Nowakowskiella sp. JEL0078]|nr:hypothetical protein HK096_000903 [Nowakowskiella sp. JEL0078]
MDTLKTAPQVDVVTGFIWIAGHDATLYCLQLELTNETRGFIVQWKMSLDAPVVSSLVIEKNRLICCTLGGKIYSVNVTNQSEEWVSSAPGPLFSSPCFANGCVLAGCVDGFLYNWSASTGELIWKYNAEAPIFASPRIHGSKVYIGSHNATMHCVNLAQGSGHWTYKSKDPSSVFTASASIVDYNEDLYVICVDSGGGLVVLGGNGKIITEKQIGGPVFSSPVCWLKNGSIWFVVGSRDDFVYLLQWDINFTT